MQLHSYRHTHAESPAIAGRAVRVRAGPWPPSEVHWDSHFCRAVKQGSDSEKQREEIWYEVTTLGRRTKSSRKYLPSPKSTSRLLTSVLGLVCYLSSVGQGVIPRVQACVSKWACVYVHIWEHLPWQGRGRQETVLHNSVLSPHPPWGSWEWSWVPQAWQNVLLPKLVWFMEILHRELSVCIYVCSHVHKS